MLHDARSAFLVLGLALRDWWNAWVGLAALSLGWLLCAVSVVLAPSATFVLYRAAELTVRGESFALADLALLMKRVFWKSWQWLLANLLAGFGLWLNLGYYGRLESFWGPGLFGLSLLLGLTWGMVQFYALPYLALEERPSLRRAFRNALLTLLASPLYTLIVLGAALAVLYASVRLPVLLFLGAPSFIAVLGTHAVAERLRTFGLRS